MHGIWAKVKAAGPFHAAEIGIAGEVVEDGQFGQLQQGAAPGHLGVVSVL
jgi:hypothetical protein